MVFSNKYLLRKFLLKILPIMPSWVDLLLTCRFWHGAGKQVWAVSLMQRVFGWLLFLPSVTEGQACQVGLWIREHFITVVLTHLGDTPNRRVNTWFCLFDLLCSVQYRLLHQMHTVTFCHAWLFLVYYVCWFRSEQIVNVNWPTLPLFKNVVVYHNSERRLHIVQWEWKTGVYQYRYASRLTMFRTPQRLWYYHTTVW